jgi:hypothetical protein
MGERMKVKIFEHLNGENLEIKINYWLKNENPIPLLMTQSEGKDDYGVYKITITILYN